MQLNLSVDQVPSTTRSVRRRLDVSKPVPRTEIEACLELALQAPNGANRNQWRWIVVDDRALIAKLAGIYRDLMRVHLEELARERGQNLAELMPAPNDIPRQKEMLDSSSHLVDILDRVPAMLIPLMEGRPEGRNCVDQAVMWGSIIQAVWSFFLALRVRGLGSAWTTVTLFGEKKVADLLRIPFDQYTQVGLFPIAYTIGTEFKPAWRKPMSEVLKYNGF